MSQYKIITNTGEEVILDYAMLKMVKEFMGEREFLSQARAIMKIN